LRGVKEKDLEEGNGVTKRGRVMKATRKCGCWSRGA